MRNRFKRASYAVAAGVTVAATIGLSAVAAGATARTPAQPAATNACGASCVDVSFVNPGRRWILASHSGLTNPNNVVRLLRGSNGLPKEDFSEIDIGTVNALYCTPAGTSISGLFTNSQCNLLVNAGLGGATTFQLAFNPNNGGDETECVGAWDNAPPASGFKLRLEDCGVAADTVLIRTAKIPGGTTTTGFWLINGASNNFSNPLVATSTGSAAPSQPTWKTVRLNGGKGVDTQETRFTPGPF
jgi:hypothetical protein